METDTSACVSSSTVDKTSSRPAAAHCSRKLCQKHKNIKHEVKTGTWLHDGPLKPPCPRGSQETLSFILKKTTQNGSRPLEYIHMKPFIETHTQCVCLLLTSEIVWLPKKRRIDWFRRTFSLVVSAVFHDDRTEYFELWYWISFLEKHKWAVVVNEPQRCNLARNIFIYSFISAYYRNNKCWVSVFLWALCSLLCG